MAVDSLPFVTWVYATTLIRDGISGKFLSEEAAHFYELSLQTMQKVVDIVDLKYTDTFIRSLACFTARAGLADMFQEAEMHRTAMLRAVTLEGKTVSSIGTSALEVMLIDFQTPPLDAFTQKAATW
ncbi:hypothetical protein DM02DRAFT_440139 [Periconia macrospinosa]|uniref:Uncharacterized protein n=1 Tax=Periconia macrospinosa TaxID=97972 RepID=A0A2V1CXM7_9PLEO|nr:hypothetical protein DM02DRAFT_440139 [Periconia macrospinosa]